MVPLLLPLHADPGNQPPPLTADRLLTAWTFEHHAANPQAPKAESLRQAMLRVMAMPKYGHPAYWAPYAVVGDGGR